MTLNIKTSDIGEN